MKALQLHYTSCRRGQSGHAGFQTRALSPGLRPDEQREIERRGIYRPPRDAPQEPSAEQLRRDFPKALRFHRLESGRWALTRSCYTGRDYSGRWGNFFAHTLVLEDGHVPPLWPIDYFEWEGWKEGLGPEEDDDRVPEPLPPVDLGEIPPAESFSLDEIREFLAEEPERPELLVRMARAAFLSRETARAVVIRDRPIQGLYWIAALQKLLTPSHALELGFSTYQDDPRGSATVNATTGETDFVFNEAERRYRFFMFDLSTGEHSEVPGEDGDYPEAVVRWLASDPSKLERFFEFMRLFEHRSLDPALVSAVHLFEFSEGEHVRWGGGRAAAMTRFASQYATPEGRVELLESIAKVSEKAAGFVGPEDFACLIRFFVDGAEATGQPRHRRMAFQAWLAALQKLLPARADGLEAVASSWDDFGRRLAPYLAELAELWLARELWNGLRPHLAAAAPEVLLFVLRVTWSCLEKAGRGAPWTAPETRLLLDALAHEEGPDRKTTQGILEVAGGDAEALAALARELARPGEADDAGLRQWRCELGRTLAGAMTGLSQQKVLEIRRLLDDETTWDVLFGEWLEIRDQARRPAQAFQEYRRSTLEQLPGYRKNCSGWVASSILDHLPAKERLPLVVEWMSSGEIDLFPEELVRRCLNVAHRAVPLDSSAGNGDETASLVAETARRHGVTLRPDRPLLREVLRTLDREPNPLGQPRLTAVRRGLEGVEAGEYETFLAGYLLPILEKAETCKQHQRVLAATLVPDELEVYRRAYLEFFQLKRKVVLSASMRSALRFWVRFDLRESDMRPIAELEVTARRGLTRVLSRLGGKSLKRLDQSLRKTRLEPHQLDRWRQIREDIEQQKRSPLAKLRRFFSPKVYQDRGM